jgi:hypothetical protein
MGMMIENKRGTPIPNPFLSVIDTLERRQLAVIRSMSLNKTASDPRTINGSAKVEGEARAALRDVGVEGLIAQPALQINYLRYYAKNRFELFGLVYPILLEKT